MSSADEPCDRFERQALLLLEAGKPLPEHFGTCPECLEARAVYDGLVDELRRHPNEPEPSGHWQAAVWSEIRRREARRSTRRALRWVTALTAAAFVALLVARPPISEPPQPAGELASTLTRDGSTRRGDEAQPGDRRQITWSIGSAAYAEIRVYQNDHRPISTCRKTPDGIEAVGSAECRFEDGSLVAELELVQRATYRTLAWYGDVEPREVLKGNLDADASHLIAEGVTVRVGRPVSVR